MWATTKKNISVGNPFSEYFLHGGKKCAITEVWCDFCFWNIFSPHHKQCQQLRCVELYTILYLYMLVVHMVAKHDALKSSCHWGRLILTSNCIMFRLDIQLGSRIFPLWQNNPYENGWFSGWRGNHPVPHPVPHHVKRLKASPTLRPRLLPLQPSPHLCRHFDGDYFYQKPIFAGKNG